MTLFNEYGNPLSLNGVLIYVNPLAVTLEPNKKHIKTRSMSENYHERVQKKWNKRYGTRQVPLMYKTEMGIIAHPAIVEKIEKELI